MEEDDTEADKVWVGGVSLFNCDSKKGVAKMVICSDPNDLVAMRR